MTDPENPTTETEQTTTVDITRAPTLPGLELPEYHGRKASGMKTSVNGAGNRLSRAHEIGERVIIVSECRVKKAGHEETDDGLIYSEVLKVNDLFEVQGDAGKRLLAAVRESYREADDGRLGRTALEADGVNIATDASGTVLTPAELAEMRGDPAAALVDEAMTPVVVVYSDNARELWPDDFPKGDLRPGAGDKFQIEGEEGPAAYVYVRELLHAETGEVLEEWTLKQEADRLLAAEQRAEADEKAEDEVTEAATPEAAYYRIEHEDGSVSELGPVEFDAFERSDDDVIYAVDDAGFEWEIPAGTEEQKFSTPTGVDEAPLPGEDGYDDGLEPLEKPDVEADPLADVIAFPPQPGPADFAKVDTDLAGLALNLSTVGNLDEARRLLEAEKQGRGRKLSTRKGAVEMIEKLIAELEANHREPGE